MTSQHGMYLICPRNINLCLLLRKFSLNDVIIEVMECRRGVRLAHWSSNTTVWWVIIWNDNHDSSKIYKQLQSCKMIRNSGFWTVFLGSLGKMIDRNHLEAEIWNIAWCDSNCCSGYDWQDYRDIWRALSRRPVPHSLFGNVNVAAYYISNWQISGKFLLAYISFIWISKITYIGYRDDVILLFRIFVICLKMDNPDQRLWSRFFICYRSSYNVQQYS